MKKQKIVDVKVIKKESVRESFKDKFFKGKANFREDLDDEVDEWHTGSYQVPLNVFLGMDEDEFSLFLVDSDLLEDKWKKEIS